MLTFDESFFHDEYRDGFLVCEEMKRAWASEMEIMARIISICDKHNIEYFIYYGTLLGAARHKGFVPWDDDIDIAMKRPDYDRFISIVRDELPEGYECNAIAISPKYYQIHGAVANAKKLPLDSKTIEEHHGCPYLLAVDVFPLDYIPRDKDIADMQYNLYNALYDTAYSFEKYKASGVLETYVSKLEELCNVTFKRDDTLLHQLWAMTDNVARMYTEEESDYMACMADRLEVNAAPPSRKQLFDELVTVQFENMEVKAPAGYRQILSDLYGDYMKPSKFGSLHSYPVYREQKEALMKAGLL